MSCNHSQYSKSCLNCNHYKKNMCICTKPKVSNKPFGFPFSYSYRKIQCESWEKENIDKWASWDHM